MYPSKLSCSFFLRSGFAVFAAISVGTTHLDARGDGDGEGDGLIDVTPSNCPNGFSNTTASVSESGGGGVNPPSTPATPTVSRPVFGAGAYAKGAPISVPVKPGQEYKVAWTGTNARSVHSKMTPRKPLPPGYKMQVNKADGSGWKDSNRLDAAAPSGSLNLSQVNHKFRIVQPIRRPGKTGPLQMTEITFNQTQYLGNIYWPYRTMSCLDANNDSRCDLKTPAARFDVSLGAALDSGKEMSAGYLIFDKPLWISSGQFLVNTGCLRYEGVANIGVEVIKDANQYIRQIKAPQAFLDIVTVSGTKFEVRLYPSSAVGALSGGLYALSGSPLSKCVVELASANDGYPAGIKTTDFDGSIQLGSTVIAARRANSHKYDVRRIEGLETKVTVVDSRQFGLNHTEVIAGQTVLLSGNVVSTPYRHTSVQTTYNGGLTEDYTERHIFLNQGEAILDRVEKFGSASGDTLTTQFRHINTSGSPGAFGKPSFRFDADGNWEKYEYNDNGDLTKTVKSYKGSPQYPFQANDSNSIVQTTGYANNPHVAIPPSAPAEFVEALKELPGDSETKVLGVTTSKTTRSYVALTVNSEPVIEATIREYRNITDYNEMVTETYAQSASQFLRGKKLSILNAQGAKTGFVYEQGTYNPATKVFTASASGTDTKMIVTMGTATSPVGIANKTTRTINIRNVEGMPLQQQTQIFTGGSNYETASTTDYSYDAMGRLVEKSRDGRIFESIIYNGLVRTGTDANGVVTVITEDLSGRILSAAKQGGVTTSSTYTGATVTTTTGSLQQVRTDDRAGRESSFTDFDGTVISYDYPNKGRDKETTYPDGIKILETNHSDGLPQSVTGNGLISRYYTHGAYADGRKWTREAIGSSGSTRYSLQTRNWLEQTIEDSTPAPSGSGTVERTTSYNAQGLIAKITYSASTGLAPRLFEYDAMGQLIREGVDSNANDTLDPASSDYIKEYSNEYEKIAGEWYIVRKQKGYLTDSNATATTVATTKLRLSALAGGYATHAIIEKSDGTIADVYQTINRTTKTVTTTSTTRGGMGFTSSRVEINGLLKEEKVSGFDDPVTYLYDALERLQTVTDPRDNSTTTRAYNAQNQIESITDAQNNVTQFFYYANTHANAGRLKERRNAANKSVYFAYNNRDQLEKTWGTAEIPSEREYDSYGQLETLKTYRAGSGWTAATWPSGTTGTADTTTWRYFTATGLLKEKEDAAGQKSTYTWKNNGRLNTRTWARGVVTTFGYDDAGLEISRTFSTETNGITTPAVTTTRDRNGRIKTVTDGSGTRTNVYTSAEQLDTITYSAGGKLGGFVIDYSYDAFGRFGGVAVKNGAITHYQNTLAYGSDGRFSSISAGTHEAKYRYHKNSHLVQQIGWSKGGEGKLYNTHSYDSLERLTSTTHLSLATGTTKAVEHRSYEYNNLHQRTKTTLLDGTYWSFNYTDRGELLTAEKHLSGGALLAGQQYHFGYDNAGNRTSKQSGGDSAGNNKRTFTTPSNNLNQYASFATPNSFDVIGKAPAATPVTVNSTTASRQGDYFRHQLTATNTGNGAWVPVNVTAASATESGHRYIPPASFTPSYDLDGNLLSDGEWNYKYDAENRLVQAERTTAAQNAGAPYRKVNYVYDSRHRRIERTVFHAPNAPPENTEKYLYDGLQRVLTADGNSQPIQSFVWGLDSSGSFNGAGGAGGLLWITDHSSNETHLVCSDDNGNVTKLIESATGEVTATYEYTPFGEIQRITGRYAASNPFRFSTKPQDSVTGLIGYTYRFFKPEWGVWLNRDPLGEAGGINLYAFLENDGINSIDLYGLANSGDVIQGAIEGAAANVLRNLAIKYGIRIGAKLALGAVGAVAGPAVIVTEAIALGLAIYDVASFVHDAYQAWKNFDEIKSQAEKAIDDFRVECMTDRTCRELSKDFGGLIADALTSGKDIKSLIKRTKDKWKRSGALRKKKSRSNTETEKQGETIRAQHATDRETADKILKEKQLGNGQGQGGRSFSREATTPGKAPSRKELEGLGVSKPEAVVEFDVSKEEVKRSIDELGDLRLPDPLDLTNRNPIKIPVTD